MGGSFLSKVLCSCMLCGANGVAGHHTVVFVCFFQRRSTALVYLHCVAECTDFAMISLLDVSLGGNKAVGRSGRLISYFVMFS